MSRRLSTTPSPFPPTQVKQAPKFPPGTLLYATAPDGSPVSFIANSLFLKRSKPGQPLPQAQVLTARDFRRATDLFAWLGKGATVEVWNSAEPAALSATAAHYGTWDGRVLTLPKN
jgi:hypothetical protein